MKTGLVIRWPCGAGACFNHAMPTPDAERPGSNLIRGACRARRSLPCWLLECDG